MAPDRGNAQPAEVIPVQAIPAGAGTGRLVKAMGVWRWPSGQESPTGSNTGERLSRALG